MFLNSSVTLILCRCIYHNEKRGACICGQTLSRSVNGVTSVFNWSAYACLCQQLTTMKDGNLTSFENHFWENFILNMLSYSLVRVKWQSSWESRWQGHSTHLQSFSIQELKLSVLGWDVIYTPCLLQIGLGSPKVNTRPWLWYYLWY